MSDAYMYDEKQYVTVPQPLTLVRLADDGFKIYMYVISHWYTGLTYDAVCLIEHGVHSS